MPSLPLALRLFLAGFALVLCGMLHQENVLAADAVPPLPPKACSTPEYHQLDFWLGSWDVHTPDGKLAGTNTITKVLGDCVLQENWVGTEGSRGMSFNIFNASAAKWHQTWVGADGLLLQLDGTLLNGVMRLEGKQPGRKGGMVMHILTLEPLPSGQVRQLWKASSDEGKTWNIVFEGFYSKRPENAAPRAP